MRTLSKHHRLDPIDGKKRNIIDLSNTNSKQADRKQSTKVLERPTEKQHKRELTSFDPHSEHFPTNSIPLPSTPPTTPFPSLIQPKYERPKFKNPKESQSHHPFSTRHPLKFHRTNRPPLTRTSRSRPLRRTNTPPLGRRHRHPPHCFGRRLSRRFSLRR